jgi:hypothetical protein
MFHKLGDIGRFDFRGIAGSSLKSEGDEAIREAPTVIDRSLAEATLVAQIVFIFSLQGLKYFHGITPVW